MSEPIPVTIETVKGPLHLRACPVCGTTYRCGADGHASYAEREARACCAPDHCERCGATRARHVLYCEPCGKVAAAEREAALFAKARKVTPDEYGDDFVFWDGRGPQEGYFASVEDLLEYCESEGIAPPAYAWGCYRQEMTMHADSLIESALDEHHEDARDQIAPGEEKRLQAFLDEWCRAQCVFSWFQDTEVAVVLASAGEASDAR